jgi:hypothetical protein
MGLSAKAGKILPGAQHGIDLLIVRRTVAVVFRTFEDGAEIDGLHP